MAAHLGHSTAGNKRPRRDALQPSEAASEGMGDDPDDDAGIGVAMAVSCYGSRVGVAWFDEGQVRCARPLPVQARMAGAGPPS